MNDQEIWREQAAAIGWEHRTVLGETQHAPMTDTERFDRAYRFAANHIAHEFHTAAVMDHDKLGCMRPAASSGPGFPAGRRFTLISVVALIEERGLS